MLGGWAIGLAVGWIIAQVRARIEDTPVEITISLLTPYAAFLPAERARRVRSDRDGRRRASTSAGAARASWAPTPA